VSDRSICELFSLMSEAKSSNVKQIWANVSKYN
jgi:hypothetical protein